MSHFAKVENSIVTQVIVAEQDVIDSGLFGGGWVQTSYNTNAGQHPEGRPLRKNYAGIGYTYDSERDAFIPPKPYTSWTLVEETCLWQCPVSYPTETNGRLYVWDEAVLNWVLPENLTVTQQLNISSDTSSAPESNNTTTNNETDNTISIDSSNGSN